MFSARRVQDIGCLTQEERASPESASERSTSEKAGPAAQRLYSAELVLDDGECRLIIHDHRRGTVQSTAVPPKLVTKIPVYLEKLDLPPGV